MTTLEYGSTREIWLATLADPTTKYSFLIRDDAFSKQGVVFGRTVRLGDPLSLGPGSGWRQLSWEGGKGQDTWRDKMMFKEGNADPYSHTGKVRLWPGFGSVQKDRTRKFDSYALGRGGQGHLFTNSDLYMGERNMWYTGGAPSGGFKAYKFDPDARSVTTLPTTPSTLGSNGYTAILTATDDASAAQFVYFGTPGGLWVYLTASNTWVQDTGAPTTGVQFDSMVSFKDAMYYCTGKKLQKRTPLAPYGVIGTHTMLKEHKAAYRTLGLAVWQNRLWYGVQYAGNRVCIGTSDGVTAAQALEMPEEFVITGLHAHYGALYIFGGKPQAVPGSNSKPASIGQVWKYSGSSLSLLWESNDEENSAAIDGKAHMVGVGCSFGSLLAWGNNGFKNSVEERAGLMFYDAEKDAIMDGPKLPSHPAGRKDGLTVNSVLAWDNTIALSYHDQHNYTKQGYPLVDFPTGVAYWRQPDFMRDNLNQYDTNAFRGASVEWRQNTRQQYIVSSVFRGDDDVANENKTWLSGRMTVRIPSRKCRLKVYAITKEGYWRPPGFNSNVFNNPTLEEREPTPTINSDGNPANVITNAGGRPVLLAEARLVHTEDYDSTDNGWRTVTFPMKYNDAYLQSVKVQYALVLENTATSNTLGSESPEVDSMEVTWMPAPTKRIQWRIRAVLQDAQLRLSGAANSLVTAQAQADKLQDFWSSKVPFLMYEPNVGAGAVGTPVEVIATDDGFSVSQFRLGSDESGVAQEVAITLIENVVQ